MVCQEPHSSVMSRQGASANSAQRTPLIMVPSSLLGRPVGDFCGGGNRDNRCLYSSLLFVLIPCPILLFHSTPILWLYKQAPKSPTMRAAALVLFSMNSWSSATSGVVLVPAIGVPNSCGWNFQK